MWGLWWGVWGWADLFEGGVWGVLYGVYGEEFEGLGELDGWVGWAFVVVRVGVGVSGRLSSAFAFGVDGWAHV